MLRQAQHMLIAESRAGYYKFASIYFNFYVLPIELRDLGLVAVFGYPAGSESHTFLKNCTLLNRYTNVMQISINVDKGHPAIIVKSFYYPKVPELKRQC